MVFELDPPMFIFGTPSALLTLIKLPISNGIDAELTLSVFLGLLTSNIIEPGRSTSKPFTYALPGDNLRANKSSLGINLLSSVNLSAVKSPSFPISSFKDS